MKNLLFILVVTFLFVIGNPNASTAQSTFKLVETAKKSYVKVDLSKHTETIEISGSSFKGGISKTGSYWVLRVSAKSGKHYKQYLGTPVASMDVEGEECTVFSNKAGTKFRVLIPNTTSKAGFKMKTVEKQ